MLNEPKGLGPFGLDKPPLGHQALGLVLGGGHGFDNELSGDGTDLLLRVWKPSPRLLWPERRLELELGPTFITRIQHTVVNTQTYSTSEKICRIRHGFLLAWGLCFLCGRILRLLDIFSFARSGFIKTTSVYKRAQRHTYLPFVRLTRAVLHSLTQHSHAPNCKIRKITVVSCSFTILRPDDGRVRAALSCVLQKLRLSASLLFLPPSAGLRATRRWAG